MIEPFLICLKCQCIQNAISTMRKNRTAWHTENWKKKYIHFIQTFTSRISIAHCPVCHLFLLQYRYNSYILEKYCNGYSKCSFKWTNRLYNIHYPCTKSREQKKKQNMLQPIFHIDTDQYYCLFPFSFQKKNILLYSIPFNLFHFLLLLPLVNWNIATNSIPG